MARVHAAGSLLLKEKKIMLCYFQKSAQGSLVECLGAYYKNRQKQRYIYMYMYLFLEMVNCIV